MRKEKKVLSSMLKKTGKSEWGMEKIVLGSRLRKTDLRFK
jgi:hypothetical protein